MSLSFQNKLETQKVYNGYCYYNKAGNHISRNGVKSLSYAKW